MTKRKQQVNNYTITWLLWGLEQAENWTGNYEGEEAEQHKVFCLFLENAIDQVRADRKLLKELLDESS